MNKFGQIKCKLLSKLTESYRKDNKTEIKNILSLIKENKDLKELYLLYEDIENKYFKDKEVAKYYVEELSKSLNGKVKSLSSILKKLDESIGLVETNYVAVYDYVDCLLEEDSLLNIDNCFNSRCCFFSYNSSIFIFPRVSSSFTYKKDDIIFIDRKNINKIY